MHAAFYQLASDIADRAKHIEEFGYSDEKKEKQMNMLDTTVCSAINGLLMGFAENIESEL